MKINRVISVLFLAAFTTGFVLVGQGSLFPAKIADVNVQTIGDVITIKKSIVENSIPQLAYSDKTNHYLVVFDEESSTYDIFGRFVDANTGIPAGDVFEIAASDAEEYSPDVVYDPFNDVFLVVWESKICGEEQEECEDKIHGRIVEEPDLKNPTQSESLLGLNEFTIATEWTSNAVLSDPKVAYNEDDHQYLVVFRAGIGEYSSLNEMNGQMLTSDAELPAVLGPPSGFNLATFGGGYFFDPDVAWSSENSSFLAVVVETDSQGIVGRTHQDIYAIWIYDTYQGGASQKFGFGRIAPGSPLSKFCGNPSVAYDPTNDTFTVVFDYDATGDDDEGLTIYGQLVNADWYADEVVIGDPFPIEVDLSKHIAFVTPAISYAGSGGTMFVVYTAREKSSNPDDEIYSLFLRVVNDSDAGQRILVRKAKDLQPIVYRPALGSSIKGFTMAVWEEEISNDVYDLLGQRIGTFFDRDYLPTIFK